MTLISPDAGGTALNPRRWPRRNPNRSQEFVALYQGLVSNWPLSTADTGEISLADDGPANRPLSASGNPPGWSSDAQITSIEHGGYGSATFNGTDQYFAASDSAGTYKPNNASFTWRMRVKLASKTFDQDFLRYGVGPMVRLFYNANEDRFLWSVKDSASGFSFCEAENIGSPVIGKWYTLIAWFDKAQRRIGLQIASGAGAELSAEPKVTYDNVRSVDGKIIQGTGSFFFGNTALLDGKLTDVTFWSRTLNAWEKLLVTYYYRADFEIANTLPVLWDWLANPPAVPAEPTP